MKEIRARSTASSTGFENFDARGGLDFGFTALECLLSRLAELW
jgi:hypothetical protein